MRLVLDSNIYISGLIFPKSKPGLILDLAAHGKYEVYCSAFIIGEVERVLIRKFGYPEIIAEQFIEKLLMFVKIIAPKSGINIIKANLDDNHILECALFVKADYLITGDKKHILPSRQIGQTSIISPAEYVDLMQRA